MIVHTGFAKNCADRNLFVDLKESQHGYVIHEKMCSIPLTRMCLSRSRSPRIVFHRHVVNSTFRISKIALICRKESVS